MDVFSVRSLCRGYVRETFEGLLDIQRYLSFTVSRHNCMYWATEEQAVNLPGMSVRCGMSSRVILGPFLFETSVTDIAYYFQCDGAPSLYLKDVRYLLDFIPQDG
jgi:hypothetical protein